MTFICYLICHFFRYCIKIQICNHKNLNTFDSYDILLSTINYDKINYIDRNNINSPEKEFDYIIQ